MNSNEKVLFSVENHIGYLILNRPERSNALNHEIFEGLDVYLQKARDESDLRVIILKGEGHSFSRGLDLSPDNAILDMIEKFSAEDTSKLYEYFLQLQEVFSGLEKIPVPVIAAVHGECIGGGLELICACDFRLASEDAIFYFPEVKGGIIPDLGGIQRFPRIVGPGMAREFIYTGKKFTAKEAKEMRLINHIYPNKDDLYREAQEIAKSIVTSNPLAVRSSKEALNYSASVSINQGLKDSAIRSVDLIRKLL